MLLFVFILALAICVIFGSSVAALVLGRLVVFFLGLLVVAILVFFLFISSITGIILMIPA